MLILIPWKPVVIVWGLLAAVPVGWVRWFVVAGGEEPIFDGPAPFRTTFTRAPRDESWTARNKSIPERWTNAMNGIIQ